MKKIKTSELIIIFVLIGFLVYLPSLFGRFVWDDEEQIVNNVLVHSAKNIPLFFKGSTFNTGGAGNLNGVYYRPLMMVLFSFIYQIFGSQAFFFHFVQISLHIGVVIVLFLIFKKFFKKELAFFLSLIFLIHPANVESVSYISAIQENLFVLFGLLAFYISIEKHNNKIFFMGLFFFLSLLSKEVAIIFIIMILLYDLIFSQKKKLNKLFILSFVVGLYFFLRFAIAKVFFTPYFFAPIVRLSLKERLFMLPSIFVFYLKLFVFPMRLAVMQHWIIKKLTIISFYIPLLTSIIFLLSGLWILLKTRSKKFLFFFVWFCLGVAPYLQIFPLDMTVAERWFYFPMIGLLGMIGVIVQKLNIKSKKLKVAFVIVILLFSLRTTKRTIDWRNGLALFDHDIQLSKNAYDLENNLGVELFRVGRYKEAKVHFKKSVGLSPNWWTNYNNLGAVYEQQGDLNKAQQNYKKAIDKGNYFLAYQNYAGILIKKNQLKKAKQFLENDAIPKLPYNQKLRTMYQYVLQKEKSKK